MLLGVVCRKLVPDPSFPFGFSQCVSGGVGVGGWEGGGWAYLIQDFGPPVALPQDQERPG